tara:strand:+ start:110 stop:658 length:549 start_codon:yes stop_codon:yes gene_type:complete
MAYAESRSKLANLLIKAGYNVAKSLRAVKYPYIESMQIIHNLTFVDYLTKDIKQYENPKDNFVTVPENGFAHTIDTEYKILGNKSKAKAFLRISQARVDHWKNYYTQTSGYLFDGTWWYSYVLKVIIKYRHKYPINEIRDSVKTIGSPKNGVATVGGDYGHQEGTIPIPLGGWLEVELPDEQ